MHRRDIGTAALSWHELRVFIEHCGSDSALYRTRNPKSWPWTVDTDLLAAILYTLQGANWQRSGGKGDRPKMVERPKDQRQLVRGEDIPVDDKRSALDDEIARRRTKKRLSNKPLGGKRVG